ncbi:MAG TPA: exopolysaccharide biosynthesis protein [Cellvibrio sp.]|nr:exopolysaccharide biosynthesis protein [Cellvibrio sp.]
MAENITTLTELIEKMADVSEQSERVSLDEVLDSIGTRSLGPLILVAGLITLAPVIGDIPGVPTIMAILVLLIAGQLLFRREHLWLPQWLLKRSISRAKMQKMLGWSRKPARFVDRYTHPRMSRLVEGKGQYLVALVCIAIALAMPLMEFVPFSANFAGLALSSFGLAMISRDGALALLALVVVGLLIGFVAFQLL